MLVQILILGDNPFNYTPRILKNAKISPKVSCYYSKSFWKQMGFSNQYYYDKITSDFKSLEYMY